VVSSGGDGKSLSRKTTFECPTCREKVSVEDLPRGIHSLPSNFWIVSMVDAVNATNSQQPRANEDGTGCDICPEDDRDNAQIRCQECRLLLCSLHSAAHSKAKDFRHHTLLHLNPGTKDSNTLNKDQNIPNKDSLAAPSQLNLTLTLSASSAPLSTKSQSFSEASSSSSCDIANPLPSRAVKGQASPASSSSSSSADPSSARRATPTVQYRCSDHPEEILKLFCDTCQVPICRDCALVDHRDHVYAFLDKSSEVHRRRLGSALSGTQVQIRGVEELEARVNELWNFVRVNSNDMLLSIRELFSEVKSALERREQDLLVQVESSRQERLLFLHQSKEKLESCRALLQSAYASSSEIHDQASDIELLMLQKTLVARLSALTSKVDLKALEAEMRPLLQPTHSSPLGRLVFSSECSAGVLHAINTLGRLTASTEPVAIGQGNHLLHHHHHHQAGKRGFGLGIGFGGSGGGIGSGGSGMGGSGGAGSGVLHHGSSALSSSLGLVKRLYDRLTAPVLRIGSNDPILAAPMDDDAAAQLTFIEPWGITVSEKEEIVIVDASRGSVHIESPPATSITKSIALPSDKHDPIPIAVAYDEAGNILVTDQANHMVKMLLSAGGCKGLGSFGTGICQFNRPTGIAIDTRPESDTWIWVVDQGNQRVQAFSQPNWNHKQTCTQFSEPCAIAVDQRSHRIVVTDTGARLHILQRGTTNHDVKVTITIKHYPNYDPDIPAATGATIDEEGNVIIADTFQNKLLVVRLSDGQIISQIGTNSTFKAPRGVYISPHGKLFVTDQHRIQAF